MASFTTGEDTGKTVPEPEPAARRPPPALSFFRADFSLRLLLFASTLSALLVLVTSKQTEPFPLPFPPFYTVVRTAKFNHSPALIYLLTALAVACFYSIVTLVVSASAILSSSPSATLLFLLVISDAVMAGVLAAATGTSGAIAYLGLKGNRHVLWGKRCNVFDKFCRHVGSAVAVSLAASIVLVALVVLSAYSLYRRSR